MPNLIWFRTDLRTQDNPALTAATANLQQPALGVVFITHQQWQEHGLGQRKIQLICTRILALQQELAELNIPLLILEANTFTACISRLQELIIQLNITDVYFNLEYGVNERRRDINFKRWCKQEAISFHQYHDQCLLAPNEGQLAGGNAGLASWINELIWREFYRHLLVAYPNLSKHQAFKENSEPAQWRTCETDFQAWCEGKTGYPLVDAAQRQLLAEGWVHNRLRMVSAMFLTKHLLIDWRKGEAFYSQYLVDADLASNNGGWQWSASTGADGVPYFRIFNPTTQAQRFDAEGEFIANYVPELANLPAKSRINPSLQERQACGYPAEIVEHKFARLRALETFKAAAF